MKMRRFAAMLLAVVLMLAGCTEAFDDSAIRADAEVLLGGFVANDYDVCRAVLNDTVTDADLETILNAIHAELAELGSYEMTAVGWNRKVSGEEDRKTVQYLIVGTTGKYYLAVSATEGMEGLSGFQLAEAAADAEATTPAGPVHALFLALNMAVVGFAIWMLVDCARRKLKLKWLWILLILLGSVVLTLTVGDGSMRLGYDLGLNISLNSLETFVKGGFRVKLCVPVAAIVYFLKRKQLTIQSVPEVEHIAEGEEEKA